MAWMGRSCRVFSKRTAPWLEERQKENSKSPRSRRTLRADEWPDSYLGGTAEVSFVLWG